MSRELVFIEVKKITEVKKECYNFDLVQNFIPKGQSRIRQALEAYDKEKSQIYDVVLAIAITSQPFNKKMAFMAARRERNSGEIVIGGWDTIPISSPPDKKAAVDLITDSFTKKQLIPLNSYKPETQLITPQSKYNPVLLINNPNHEFQYPVRGFRQEGWNNAAGSSVTFWEANKDKIQIKHEKAEDFYYLSNGKLSPKITGWHFNSLRSAQAEPLLTSCVNQIGHYFNNQSYAKFESSLPKLTSFIESDQPNYDELNQLQFFFSVERGVNATTTIVVLRIEYKVEDKEITLEEITLEDSKEYNNPQPSGVVHQWLAEKMNEIQEEYSTSLNLEGNPKIKAKMYGRPTLLCTNDSTLELDATPLEIETEEDGIKEIETIEVKDFRTTYVDLFDPSSFDLNQSLSLIRGAIAEERLILDPHLESEFYEDLEFKQLHRINRGIALIYSQLQLTFDD